MRLIPCVEDSIPSHVNFRFLQVALLAAFVCAGAGLGCDEATAPTSGSGGSIVEPEGIGSPDSMDLPGIPDAGGGTFPDLGGSGGSDTGTDSGDGGGGETNGDEVDDWGIPTSPAQGQLGWPCQDNVDCESGFCIQSPVGKICTQICIETCPPSWTCSEVATIGTDVAFVCKPWFMALCNPCKIQEDCSEAGVFSGAECIDFGSIGRFCGGDCGGAIKCPPGYTCQDVPGAAGPPARQCIPVSGQCNCSPMATQLKLETSCYAQNAFGKCFGSRFCGADGLSECNAGAPSAEICDGIDNDCNGLVDDLPPSLACDVVNVFGACPGTVKCEGGTQTCIGPAPEKEECDGIDNDCNGIVDDAQCDDGNPCTKGECGPEFACVFSPWPGPCDDNNVCTTGDNCSAGNCIGSPISCSDGNTCTSNPCDQFIGCLSEPASNGTPCDDGNACTTADICDAGVCKGFQSLTCDDGNACTTDFCDPIKGCQVSPIPNGLPCDDGNPCTATSTCYNGQCLGQQLTICNDGNPCTVDTCDPASGCKYTPSVNGTACNDGNACTQGDSCVNGTCTGTGLNCNDGNACTEDNCNLATGCSYVKLTGQTCNDGNACTQFDVCENGVCAGKNPLLCNDNNPCTSDFCNPASGCVFQPLANNSVCDDGNPCTTGDKCQNGSCQGAGKNCDDSNPCTQDSCNAIGNCVNNKLTGPACNDGSVCTQTDSCENGVCVGKNALVCNDGNVCSDDSCNAITGCVFNTTSANGKACNNGDACTISAQCAGGKCSSVQKVQCNVAGCLFSTCIDAFGVPLCVCL